MHTFVKTYQTSIYFQPVLPSDGETSVDDATCMKNTSTSSNTYIYIYILAQTEQIIDGRNSTELTESIIRLVVTPTGPGFVLLLLHVSSRSVTHHPWYQFM
jgi:hypothetical protein